MAQKSDVQIQIVSSDKIEATDEWNGRSDYRTDAEDKGWNAFVENIAEVGQEQPCIVRPHDKVKGHYILVAGFRRFHAIQELEASTQKKIGVKVIVHNLSEAEAAVLNARENITRQDLTAPDLCFSVGRARDAAKDGGTFANISKFAVQLGLKQPWVHRLVTIWDKLDRDTFDHWRKVALVKLPVMTMADIAENTEKEKQFEVYQKTLKLKERASKVKEPSKKTAEEKAIVKAIKIAELLGLLEAESLLVRPASNWQWDDVCEVANVFDALSEDELKESKARIAEAAKGAHSRAFSDSEAVRARMLETEKAEKAKTSRKAATA